MISHLNNLKAASMLLSALSLCLLVIIAAPGQGQEADVLEERESVTDEAQERVVIYPNGEEAIEEEATRAEQVEELERRAGEQIGEDPHGRAAVLGMFIQESDRGRGKVVEVSPATPAFDAGIRAGDEILSFDGFKAESYREWVDGIRRLVNDAPEGDTMPIQLLRDRRMINLRLRKPIAKADDPRLDVPRTLNRQGLERQLAQPQPIIQPVPPAGQPAHGVGGDVLVADFFGGRFDQTLGGTSGRAVAEIFRLHGTPQPVPGNVGTPAGQRNELRTGGTQGGQATDIRPGTTTPATATGTGMGETRIGLAGFRNIPGGMLVMLDAGGLSPGNYLVGIQDAGLIGATGAVGTELPAGRPPQELESQFERPQPGVVPEPLRDRSQPAVPPPQRIREPGGNAPATTPPGTQRSRQSQSQLQPLRQQVPQTVLAQVVDAPQSDAADAGATEAAAAPQEAPATAPLGSPETPDTGDTRPLVPPSAGPIGSPDRPPTGQPSDAGALEQDATGRADAAADQQDVLGGTATSGAGPGIGPAITVGVLTVDASGTGRLQQVVEAVQVQHVVGQAIVIYTQQVPSDNTLPANLDTGAAAGTPTPPGQSDARAGRGGDAAASTALPPRTPNQPALQPQGAAQPNGSHTPVAAGMIRWLSDVAPTDIAEGVEQPQEPAASLPSETEVR